MIVYVRIKLDLVTLNDRNAQKYLQITIGKKYFVVFISHIIWQSSISFALFQ